MINVDDLEGVALAAAIENKVRRELAEVIDVARKEQGFTIRGLAKAMDCSKAQVRRLLHKELGGHLYLGTIIRAMNVLGLKLFLEE